MEAGRWTRGRTLHAVYPRSMLLFLEVLGVLAGAVLLAALAGRGVSRRSFALGAALVPAALACVLLGASLWPTTRNILAQRTRDAALAPAAAQLAPGHSADVDVEFVEWARERIPPGATIHVLPGDEKGFQWVTYRLLPSLAVDRPEEAEWLVFYDHEPDEGDYPLEDFEDPEEFEEGFGVAKRAE